MNLKAAMERSKLSSGVRRELRKHSGGGGGVEGEGVGGVDMRWEDKRGQFTLQCTFSHGPL